MSGNVGCSEANGGFLRKTLLRNRRGTEKLTAVFLGGRGGCMTLVPYNRTNKASRCDPEILLKTIITRQGEFRIPCTIKSRGHGLGRIKHAHNILRVTVKL